MKATVLVAIGAFLMAGGFSAAVYSSYFLLPVTGPPTMRPLEGIDYALFVYRPTFLLSGTMGIFVAIAGVFWRRRK